MTLEILVVIFGLCLFEVISSIDNAIINAHVLKTLPEKYRKFFLFWGLIFAVFRMVIFGRKKIRIFCRTFHSSPSRLVLCVFFSIFYSHYMDFAQDKSNTGIIGSIRDNRIFYYRRLQKKCRSKRKRIIIIS